MTYPRPNNNFKAFSPLFGILSGADFIGSSRKIIPEYAGSCCRVRRVTGAVDADFGFVAGVIDSAAIVTHCTVAGNAGKVTRIYNQLVPGNADFATIPTPDNGPGIVVAGAYVPKFGAFQVNNPGDVLTLPARGIAQTALTILVGADITLNAGTAQSVWWWAASGSSFPIFNLMHQSAAPWICSIQNTASVHYKGKTVVLNGGGSYQQIITTLDGINTSTPSVLVSVDGVNQATVNDGGAYVPFASFPTNRVLTVQGIGGAANDSGMKLRDIFFWTRALSAAEISIVTDYLATLPGA